MNRGSALQASQANECIGCFNEAPIHESGKCDSCQPPLSAQKGFNEAPIHESGKSTAPP